jgi:hypothetical protein
MPDKLAAWFSVLINGRVFRSAPLEESIERPSALEIEHRDQELSRLHLTVWDDPGDEPFPIFNSLPNPRTVTTVPVIAYIRWEDETPVKAFEGYLAAKKLRSKLSYTELVATHEAIKMKKRGEVRALKQMTLAAALVKIAADSGITLTIDPSAAGDDALNTPFEVLFQAGDPPWDLLRHYVLELGYVLNTIRANVVVLRVDKSAGERVEVVFGGDIFKSIDLRYEQRQSSRASRRKGHGHNPKQGVAAHHTDGNEDSKAKDVRSEPPAIVKRSDQRRMTYSRFSAKGKARRLEREGDELTVETRLIPQLRNEEVIVLQGFGPQIDGEWMTASVLHRIGNGPATSQIACWRP